jgi:hypothetical protein
LEPSAEATAKQQSGFERLVGLLKQKWPEAKGSPFGSAAWKLAVSGVNDIDVILELDGVKNIKKVWGCKGFPGAWGAEVEPSKRNSGPLNNFLLRKYAS